MKPPFNLNTPLSPFPFNSRTGKNEFDLYAPSKNYILHGFKPGNSLQASELNEIQENYYKNFTLYNFLMKNWFFLGNGGMVAGNESKPITGPSWLGAVPLHPTSSVVISGNSIVFKKDWYLVDDFSGIKFWIYNNVERSVPIPDNNKYVGMTIERKYITPIDDPDLHDNSNGFSDSSLSPGADRVQLNFIGAYTSETKTTLSDTKRDILYINEGKISYINNLLKYSIS